MLLLLHLAETNKLAILKRKVKVFRSYLLIEKVYVREGESE